MLSLSKHARRYLALTMLLMPVGCSSHGHLSPHDSDAASMVVLYFPERVETVIDLNPADLQRIYTVKILVKANDVSTQAFGIANSDFEYDPAQSSDVRWGLTVQNSAGKSIGTYYVDKFGTSGYANGRRARFNRALWRWLHGACGVCR